MTTSKKIPVAALLILVLTMAVVLTGCGSSGAKSKVTSDLAERLDAIVAGDYSALGALADGLDADDLSDIGIDEDSLLAAFLEGFSYSIEDVTAKNGEATATVVFTVKSYSEFYAYFSEAAFDIPLDYSNASDSKLATLYAQAVYDALSNASTVQVSVEFSYSKENRTWAPTDDFEQMLADALLSA